MNVHRWGHFIISDGSTEERDKKLRAIPQGWMCLTLWAQVVNSAQAKLFWSLELRKLVLYQHMPGNNKGTLRFLGSRAHPNPEGQRHVDE